MYPTNAVKHFEFEERGKRRIHKQPDRTEIVAGSAWLEAEMSVVRSRLVVCLGAVAAKAVLGSSASATALDPGRPSRTGGTAGAWGWWSRDSSAVNRVAPMRVGIGCAELV